MLSGPQSPPQVGSREAPVELNYLVASDLHLTLVYDDEDHATDVELIAFLEHYQAHLVDGRPWRLVLAGDSFDFVYPDLSLFVAKEGHPDDAPVADGASFLEHWDVEAVAWRLRSTIRQRADLFRALATFVLHGNHLVLIKGNHDVELQWAVVQRAFLDGLVEVTGGTAAERDELEARVTFHDWFYLCEGQLWVEHGNQYDEFNASPNFIDPALVTDSSRAFAPLGSRMTQYLTNAFVDYKPGPAHGTFMGYIVRTNQLFSKKFLGRSLDVIRHALVHAGLFSEEGWRTGSGREDHAIRELEQRSGVDADLLLAAQALQSRPATAIRGFFFNRMLLDRLFVAAFTLGLLVVALAWGLFLPTEPALLAGLTLGPIAVGIGALARFKLKKRGLPLQVGIPTALIGGCLAAAWLVDGATPLGTGLVTTAVGVVSVSLAIMPLPALPDLGEHLAATAEQLRRIFGVRVVVFGHHHRPVRHELSGGAVYINSGAWVNTGVEANHAHVVAVRDESGDLVASLHLGRDFLGASP